MKTTRIGIFIFLLFLLVFISACTIGGNTTVAPTRTPYIITATFPPSAEGETDVAATQTAEAASIVEPEPEAHTLPAELKLVYTDTTGNLFRWTEAAGASAILASGDIMGPVLSDDGQWVAFVRNSDFVHYSLWVVNFDGSGERQLVNQDQFFDMKNSEEAISAQPYIYDWVPGTHTIAFNTSPSFEGPGLMINDDLRLVNADSGALSTLLSPGDGGVFYYSPDGTQIALVKSDSISLINADGSNRRSNVLEYEWVLTYSEYMYYAEPLWSADSTFLRVAIPPHDPLGDPAAQTTLWHIPTDGSAAGIAGHVTIAPLTSVRISPDMGWIAYLSYFGDATDNRRNLHINNFSGSADHVYTTGQVDLNAWAPDSTHFVYVNHDTSSSKYADKDGGETLLIPSGMAVWFNFINEYTYIYTWNTGAEWQLVHGNVDGTQTVIASMPLASKLPNYSFVY
jgi:hypothetical protein